MEEEKRVAFYGSEKVDLLMPCTFMKKALQVFKIRFQRKSSQTLSLVDQLQSVEDASIQSWECGGCHNVDYKRKISKMC